MPDIKIFVSCHKPTVLPECDLFVPIQVGAALSNYDMPMLHDNIGDNISEKNRQYCELTGQYWVWKHVDTEYYGFCHYRRYFSFSDTPVKLNIWGTHIYDVLSKTVQKELGMNPASIEQCVTKADFIVGTSMDFKTQKYSSLYHQYDASPELHIRDLKLAVEILKEKYPDYSEAADLYLNGTVFYPSNMFIMKKNLFLEYSEWLFTILEEVESRMDMSDYSAEGKRTIGHIAERLLGVFFTKKQSDGISTSILPRTVMRYTDPIVFPNPAFQTRNIPVVLCCNNDYVPYASVMLQSLLSHASLQDNYDIHILHTDIPSGQQRFLSTLTGSRENVSLRFINVVELTDGLAEMVGSQDELPKYYRLFIPYLFRNYEKVLYLDSDLVVLHDISDLYNIETDDNMIAAAVDMEQAARYGSDIRDVMEYYTRVLEMENPYRYFQTGVILFNIQQFGTLKESSESLIERCSFKGVILSAEDVLNVICNNHVKDIPLKWNVITNTNRNQIRIESLIQRAAPEWLWQYYQEAKEDPFIVHYSGKNKPWSSLDTDMAYYFWPYARQTPFYETIVGRMTRDFTIKDIHADIARITRKIENNTKNIDDIYRILDQTITQRIKKVMFPVGSRRRAILQSLKSRIT